MKILIRNAEIINSASKYHLKKRNILVENGIIKYIGTSSPESDKLVQGDNLKVSGGWCDMNALFGDPGYEYKEDIQSGTMAAANGGFTDIALLPNTNPVIQTKSDLAYLTSGNSKRLTQIHPIAAITHDLKGEDLTDMIDLHEAGAIAFSDGTQPVWQTDILLKTLQYLQKFNGVLINRPEDIYLNRFGTMHEGEVSTILGMKGMPSISEEVMVTRDLQLLEYAGGKIHFSKISTSGTVRLIRKAKSNGLNVTCDVAAHQLVLTDSELEDYDSNYKVNPPLRGKKDIKALIQAVNDDTIDAIVSAHRPHDEESKKLEFDHADFGITGLQTVLPFILKATPAITVEKFVQKLTERPRTILGLEIPEIKEGNKANLTVFSPSEVWKFDENSNMSKSVNSPLFGEELTGKVKAVFNNKKQLIID